MFGKLIPASLTYTLMFVIRYNCWCRYILCSFFIFVCSWYEAVVYLSLERSDWDHVARIRKQDGVELADARFSDRRGSLFWRLQAAGRGYEQLVDVASSVEPGAVTIVAGTEHSAAVKLHRSQHRLYSVVTKTVWQSRTV